MEKRTLSASSLGKKAENFKRLAENRTNNILKSLRLLGNLSNTHNYSYTKEEISKIFNAIESEVKRVKILFKKPTKDEFKL